MPKTVALPYAGRELTCAVPDERLQDVLTLRDVPAASDLPRLIEDTLDHPIGSPRLEELARGVSEALIIIDDITRPTPTATILPHLIRRLQTAGLQDDHIRLLVALGTHRLMSHPELEHKLGAEILAGFRVLQHAHTDERNLVSLGTTSGGVPIIISRWVAESPLVVAVGNIIPHRYCGWSGGAKMIQPGVAGAAAIADTHLRAALNEDVALGVVENSVRHEMEEVAAHVALRFIVNTVLTRRGALYRVVAGEVRQAFRAGVRYAMDVVSVEFDAPASVVLAASYPCELNFWQAGKTLYAADLLVRDQGVIILVAPCIEGVGEHPEFVSLVPEGVQAILERVQRGAVEDLIGVAAAILVARVAARARIFIVSGGLSAEIVTAMGFRHFSSVQEAVDEALAVTGPNSRMLVLREGCEALPILRQPSVA